MPVSKTDWKKERDTKQGEGPKVYNEGAGPGASREILKRGARTSWNAPMEPTDLAHILGMMARNVRLRRQRQHGKTVEERLKELFG